MGHCQKILGMWLRAAAVLAGVMACCAALAASQPAWADDADDTAAHLGDVTGATSTNTNAPKSDTGAKSDYFAFLPGYGFPQKKIGSTGEAFTFTGLYGHPLSPHFDLEANFTGSIIETGIDGGTDFYQKGLGLDLVWDLTSHRGEQFTPFILAGIGAVYDDFYPNSRDGAAFIAGLGLGVVSPPLFNNRLFLRAEARYVYDTHEGGYSEPRVSLGIEIPVGRVEQRVMYLPAREVEVHEVVKEIITEIKHPFIDSDGDGVDDEHDKCPDTPRGLRVDSNGCVITPQVIELTGVNFRFNKSELTDNADAVLDMVSRAFLGQPSLRVEIAGHTDGIGRAAYNQALSERRAEAVRTYLISKGVRPEQLSAHGYGATQPLIHPEMDDRDRGRNRRVEFRVLSGQ